MERGGEGEGEEREKGRRGRRGGEGAGGGSREKGTSKEERGRRDLVLPLCSPVFSGRLRNGVVCLRPWEKGDWLLTYLWD